ncbi:hypothetical protein FHG87_024236 [Trinorchestia longiramus]|nr:hypothetical protein FHG87_024236 [Trinorchestia longiramus]
MADSTPSNANETKHFSQNVQHKMPSPHVESLSTLPDLSDRKESTVSAGGQKEARSIVFKLDSMKTNLKILGKSALSGFDDDDPKSKRPKLAFETFERYREAKAAKSSASESESSSVSQEQTSDDSNKGASIQHTGSTVLSPSQDPSKTEDPNHRSGSESVACTQSICREMDVDAVDSDKEKSSNEGSQLTDQPQGVFEVQHGSSLNHKQDVQKNALPRDERCKDFSPARPDGPLESQMPEKSSESNEEASSTDKKSKSPDRKLEKSPDRKKNRSPDRRRDRSPDRKRNRSLDGKRDRSPDHKRRRSPDRKRDRSPDRKRDRSPDRKRDRSPDRKRDRSPDRKRDRSPDRKRERSPERRREKSLERRREKSPNRRRERSPERRRIRSPDRKQDRPRDRSPMRRQEESRDRSPRPSRRAQGDSKDRTRSPDRRSRECTRGRSSSPARDVNRRSPDQWQSEVTADQSRDHCVDSRGERSVDNSRQASPTGSTTHESSPKKIPSLVQRQYSAKSTEFVSEEEHRPEWNYDPSELDDPVFPEWSTSIQASNNNVLIDTSCAGNKANLPTEAPPLPVSGAVQSQGGPEQPEAQDSNAGGEFSPSPPGSPERRLSLDDRLAREHGLVIHEEQEPPPVQIDGAKPVWKVPTFSAPVSSGVP